jgi:hypothetical protein
MKRSNDVLAPIVHSFVAVDAIIVLALMLAGRDFFMSMGAGIGLALTFFAAHSAPYVFLAAQHCALFLSLPFMFKLLYGEFPGGASDLPYLDSALVLIYLGLGLLALGVRLGAGRINPLRIDPKRVPLRALFICVLVVFSVDWVARVENNIIGGGLAQIVNEIVKFRYLFFVLLLFGALAARRGSSYVMVAALFILVPQATSHMSGFAGVPILLAYSAVTFVFLSDGAGFTRADVVRTLKLFTMAVAIVLSMGLVWTGGLKPAWRAAVLSGAVGQSTTERLATFAAYFGDSLASFDVRHALDELSSRTSSGMFFTAMTLERVPSEIPHTGGTHTASAVGHILMPRLLFPDKPILASDSELVRLYTGRYVAGEESGTSIGLGYIAEFYVDFGYVGALIACLFLGVYCGLFFRFWQYLCRIPSLVHAAAVLVAWSSLNVADASLVKLVGSITMQGLVFLILLLGLRRFKLARRFVPLPVRPYGIYSDFSLELRSRVATPR